MLIKVFCVVSMLSKRCVGGGGATGLLNKGGGSNRLPVEIPQVQTSTLMIVRRNNVSTIFKFDQLVVPLFLLHQAINPEEEEEEVVDSTWQPWQYPS